MSESKRTEDGIALRTCTDSSAESRLRSSLIAACSTARLMSKTALPLDTAGRMTTLRLRRDTASAAASACAAAAVSAVNASASDVVTTAC